MIKQLYSYLRILKQRIRDGFYMVATVVSPKLNTQLLYKKVFGKKIDFSNPKDFKEKLCWLKVYNYNKNPLVYRCADKLLVRDYIRECGCEEILNDLYYVYNNPKEINWDNLPNQFVLKWNFGAGMNYVCKDKSKINTNELIAQLTKWGGVKYWLPYSEMQYKYIPKKIICEKYLSEDTKEVISDYKVYCFNGQPLAILVMHDRGHTIKTEFFDEKWNSLKNSSKYTTPECKTARPECLNQMLEVSEKLSKPFPFVRCDYYIVNNKLYFGEMTFTPAGCMWPSETKIGDKTMGELLDLSK